MNGNQRERDHDGDNADHNPARNSVRHFFQKPLRSVRPHMSERLGTCQPTSEHHFDLRRFILTTPRE